VSKLTQKLILSSSPHASGPESVPRIMYVVVLALLPAVVAAILFFGMKALAVMLVAVVAAVVVEALILMLRGESAKRAWRRALDGSALITGLLLALNLPANSPPWMVVIGVVIAIGVGKHVFGGLGNNIFNPALVGRVFLLISFPALMSTWMKVPEAGTERWNAPFESLDSLTGKVEGVEAFTEATPLGLIKTQKNAALGVKETQARYGRDIKSFLPLLIGKRGGSLGETSVLALLIGAIFMFWRGVIRWHIPLSFIGATLAVTGMMWLIDPSIYLNPIYHLLTGGLIIGAFFMATDMVTSPVSPMGMIVFGAGAGILTAVIRLWGSFPEGVSFAILIMNGLVPLIDQKFHPRRFGVGPEPGNKTTQEAHNG
jgi:H+/Na+-translocating ferredoxin:NAD+ oxidoreductase subunit D